MKSETLYSDDVRKIDETRRNYPIHSSEVGEIIELSGILYSFGVDVVDELSKIYTKCELDRDSRACSEGE